MKIKTANITPPIPVRCFDWIAWIDGQEEDEMAGHGWTELSALHRLLLLRDDAEFNKAVWMAIFDAEGRANE